MKGVWHNKTATINSPDALSVAGPQFSTYRQSIPPRHPATSCRTKRQRYQTHSSWYHMPCLTPVRPLLLDHHRSVTIFQVRRYHDERGWMPPQSTKADPFGPRGGERASARLIPPWWRRRMVHHGHHYCYCRLLPRHLDCRDLLSLEKTETNLAPTNRCW